MMDIQGINIVKRGQKSKRWCRLEKTKYASNDTEVLKNRLLVTDEELRCVLVVGRKTAKAIAQDCRFSKSILYKRCRQCRTMNRF